MDIVSHNRRAWNHQSKTGNEWTIPVSAATIAAARKGDFEVVLTPNKPVPKNWFGDLENTSVLCLASGGGQQAPVLAAAGARVVGVDVSEEQLKADRFVANREKLPLVTLQATMTSLPLRTATFDLVFNPVSCIFIADVRPLWDECYRVLKPGGTLLTGLMNPSFYLFDIDENEDPGEFKVTYALPYSDLKSLPDAKRRRRIEDNEPLEFSHSLESLLGGQLAAGFSITGFYEDWWNDDATLLNRFTPTSMAVRAIKAR